MLSYIIISTFIVSLISFVGVFTLGIGKDKIQHFLLYLVSFSTGAMLGDAFIHLLPQYVEQNGFPISGSLSLLSGIVAFFIIEKFIHWHHCHFDGNEEHIHPFAWANLIGDGVHNFIDGLIIAASYLVSIPVGFATTIAVIFHEIPQEIGDFGVLLHGGFSRGKALFYNFLIGLTAVAGALIGFALGKVAGVLQFLIPFAAGNFIYIAGSDLIPELHKEVKLSKSFMQLLYFLFGIAIMYILLLLE